MCCAKLLTYVGGSTHGRMLYSTKKKKGGNVITTALGDEYRFGSAFGDKSSSSTILINNYYCVSRNQAPDPPPFFGTVAIDPYHFLNPTDTMATTHP